MKHIVLISLMSLFLQAFEYNLVPKKVAEDTYCFFGKLENISKENGGNMVNTCFVHTKEGFVVIDSGPTYDYASQAYERMQQIAKLPVKYVITTHDHDDHWLGNSFYKSKGALLIGPRTYEQNVVAGMETRMQRVLGKELYGKTSIVKLDTIVDNNLTLKAGDKVFMISQPVKAAHTKGDLIVFLKGQKVLFAGDLVFSGRLTSLRDGSLVGSLEALDKIDAYGAKVIVGGHGYETDATVTKHFRSYLQEMKKEVQDALDEDVGMEDITKKVTMPQYKNMKLYDVLHARNVLDAYKELEMIEDEE
ncbi:MBL fold metallo-hydrolase [Sulfurovum sp. NBC37-1]|uniref:MBL fold metallo-hydrolase n=1 Tax=Sulfurovum sp. (strain NBC37-1) TaxID=387093 RepID=UPI0001587500|nr:MBL fold metallo-hydrolase [Sulfurovum sp. NBC37-1]BAF71463.1 metallo-beta-lactamase family protein [Sulfurovum sp. NBC37-1]